MAAFIFFLQNSLPACLHDVDRHFSVCQRNNVKGWILAIKWFPLYGKCGNKCVHARYTHTHIFLTYFQTKKKMFVCSYNYRNVSPSRTNSKRGRNSELAGARAWLTPDWVQLTVYNMTHSLQSSGMPLLVSSSTTCISTPNFLKFWCNN